ncbi:MAG: insulinase family protein [Bacteroidetes bacterium]|jgi:zinc protease|nr:insulinase family protein [Bacteroidota bacterium]
MRKLAFLLAAAAMGLAAQSAKISVPYEQFRLPNGLNVILHVDRTTPTISVNTWFHVGSGYEEPGRTGFAHLFEHLMFEGSKSVPEGKFDEWLEAAGGNNNGSTTEDRTNYFEDIPSNALELALFLDSDRMGYLLDPMTQEKLDGQRDIVKNERRQSYENRPYGMADIILNHYLFPDKHPYSWPVIGSMADLSAASLDDVKNFFRRYYAPNNASLVVAGDIDVAKTKSLVTKWFAEIPRGQPISPQAVPASVLNEERRLIIEDRVQLPRLYIQWISPAQYTPGDAELDMVADVLAGGKNSRLYKRLVYDMQIAQDVAAYQGSMRLCSQFTIVATARVGHTLAELEKIIQEEIDRLKSDPPTDREVQRTKNKYESSFLSRLEGVGGFGGKADQLNRYYYATGNPDYFQEDLARYMGIEPGDVRAMAVKHLRNDARVVLSVVPRGKQDLSAPGSLVSTEGK